MADQPDRPAGRVHASYRRSNGRWSTPVCRGNETQAKSYADHVDGYLQRDARWRFDPCDCPAVLS